MSVSDGAPSGSRLVASGLERVLRTVLPDGVMDVRYLPWDAVPVVRVELWSRDASRYVELVRGFLDSINTRKWRLVRPVFFGGGLEDVDVALLNPGWFAARPDVHYGRGYKEAVGVAESVGAVLARASLVSCVLVEPDVWTDGRGVVRLTLTVPGAWSLAGLTEIVHSSRPEVCSF
jgi:hypothetical protein